MTALAVLNGVEIQSRENETPVRPTYFPMALDEVWRMAEAVAKGGLFPGARTAEQALTLMLICQADGLHPIQAIRRFHVIEGRPAMRADAIQAEFQARGGRIRWVQSDADVCEAQFSHPKFHPEPLTIRMELKRFVENKVAMTYNEKGNRWDFKKNWGNWPEAMLRARVASAGVRAIDPGVIVGIASEDEVYDAIASERPVPFAVIHEESKAEAVAAITAEDSPVPGHDPRLPDTRPYVLMATEAVVATNALVGQNWGDAPDPPEAMDPKRLHGLVVKKAINLGYADGPVPTKVQQAVALASKVYAAERQWVRREVTGACQEHAEAVAERLRALREAAEPEGMSEADMAELAGIEEPGAEG